VDKTLKYTETVKSTKTASFLVKMEIMNQLQL